MIKAATLVELLQIRARNQAQEVAYRFLKDGERENQSCTYAQLAEKAEAIAAYLQSLNLAQQRVIIIYPYEQGLEFIAAFFGCLYAGAVAVTCHPPLSRHSLSEIQERLDSAQAQALMTHPSLLNKLKSQLTPPPKPFHWVVTEDIPTNLAPHWLPPEISPSSLAFLQYTSGSTGKPKGVMINHECILYNQKMLQEAFGHNHTSVGVGWLPLFHDMGLIGKVIQALYLGRPSIFMSPVAFIQKPVRWLQAISDYRATTSGAPNFAYDLLCRHVTAEQRANLDLSSWEVAFSGAEPIQIETLDRFCELFSPCGFRREAFYSGYGIAEATLLVTGSQKNRPLVLQYAHEANLEKNRVLLSQEAKAGFLPLIGCGKAWLDERVLIVNPQTKQRCAENEVGEIWVSGSGLGKGYWQEPEKTKATFGAFLADTQEGPYLRTGDLGFLVGEELFITGRLNDVLVFWGLNHYPQLIEQTVADCHEALRPNCGAAFAVKLAGQERLVIAQEVERNYRYKLEVGEIVELIRWSVFAKHLVDVYAIVLLKPGTIPKTSSGKIQRQACRQEFMENNLEVLAQWCCLPEQSLDMTSMLRYYFNPLTHLKRYRIIWQAKAQRFLSSLNL